MGRAIALRDDYDGPVLRRLAKASKCPGQIRRLLSLAEIYDGGKRTKAARTGDVGLQIVRDWVLRFNAYGPDGLIDGKASGRRSKLNDAQRQALSRMVESGPIPAIHGVVRWRRKDLALWIFEEFGISLEETTVGRELRALGFRKISARPRHKGQNEFAVEDFKKTSQSSWRPSATGFPPIPSWKYGGRTKPGLVKRPSSRDVGLPGEVVLQPPRINGRSRPGYSVPSAPSAALARGLFSLDATPGPCNGTSMKSRCK